MVICLLVNKTDITFLLIPDQITTKKVQRISMKKLLMNYFNSVNDSENNNLINYIKSFNNNNNNINLIIGNNRCGFISVDNILFYTYTKSKSNLNSIKDLTAAIKAVTSLFNANKNSSQNYNTTTNFEIKNNMNVTQNHEKQMKKLQENLLNMPYYKKLSEINS